MSREVVYRGRKIEVALDVTVLPDGQTIRRDIVTHPGAVAILPLVDANHLCLLRNHRFVVGEVLWEIPAGTLEPNEPIEQAAIRELEEETGYRAASWQKLAAFYPSPGVLSEITHLFVAEKLTAGQARPEADEELQAQVVPWTQAMAWTEDGTIRDAKTLLALLMWEKRRAELLRRQ